MKKFFCFLGFILLIFIGLRSFFRVVDNVSLPIDAYILGIIGLILLFFIMVGLRNLINSLGDVISTRKNKKDLYYKKK